MIARAHQLIQEGLYVSNIVADILLTRLSKFMFPDNDLVTVWSAPNYCYRCG